VQQPKAWRVTLLHVLGAGGDGGAETYFLRLVEAFRRAGIAQAVALRAHPGREAALARMGVPARTFSFSPLALTTRSAIARFARAQGARALLGWMSRGASRMPGGPWTRIGRLGGYYDLRYFRRCDLLVANTADIRDHILRGGWPAERVHHIRNFAEPGGHPPLPRAACDTPPRVPLLLGVGRLHPAKAHDLSLRALARLPNAWLWIAGAGPEEASLRRLATTLGVADRVRFLGWREDTGVLYRAADVCVFPSRVEPLGNVVIEAWAHGLPVVAARAVGPAALIRDGEDGLLVPVEDSDALAAATARLLRDAALRERLRANGWRRWEAEFSARGVVEQWRPLLGF
jgi:glycosyltransferase involved in cell wall biosynthesis